MSPPRRGPAGEDRGGPLGGRRLVVASNRLPVVLERAGSGGWRVESGAGGLVTGLAPVVERYGAVWVGWPGVVDGDEDEVARVLEGASGPRGCRFRPVLLTSEEHDRFYHGASNEILWPLFHDLPSHCNFDPRYWTAYEEVNRKFAAAVARAAAGDDFVWVHDYHLILLGAELRRRGADRGAGFFLHIPFPSLDLFLNLPWRGRLLDGLLAYDPVGFQTDRDRRNFLQCLDALAGRVEVEEDGRVARIRVGDRRLRVGVFPIAIDFEAFVRGVSSPEVVALARTIRDQLPHRQLVLGVDRQDYTKGIPNKLRAFRLALERHPELQGHVSLVQLVVPSREEVPGYPELIVEIQRLVGEINGELTRTGWIPVHFVYRSWEREELLAYYRAADAALVTPFKDGMNLVAKEYCACNVQEDGVLILSEFAGAADQLGADAILVNPYHVEGVAEAIHRALAMPREERRSRMRRLRERVRREDIYWWAETFLRAAA